MASGKISSRQLASFKGQLVLVGAGKMGGAMLQGWLARGLPPKQIAVLEPEPSKTVKALAKRGIALNKPAGKVKAATIVVAIKPQDAETVMPTLKAHASKATLVVSIMAGRTLGFLEKHFPAGTPIVRAMPNLPAAIGRGITVAAPNKQVTPVHRFTATNLLAAIGIVEWIADEKLLDAVTATSGSGPAYVFLLAEALTAAAIGSGLPAPLAARLARETVAGAGELLKRSRLDAATLRKNVTSPGGTTAAALETLLSTAVARATRRSRELAG